VFTARPAIAALDRLGVDAAPVLRAAQLSRRALASADLRLPWPSVAVLWEAAAVAARDPAFGSHVAATLPPGAFDLLDYLMSAAATSGEGLARVAHFIRLAYDGSDLTLVIGRGHASLVRRSSSSTRHYDDFLLTLLLVRSRQATGSDWAPSRVAFQHDEGPGSDGVARVFRCPITFGAAVMDMRFALGILELPHLHADSALLSILVRYAESLLESLPKGDDIVARASSSIARQFATKLPVLSATARALHVSERSLQRRLAREGTTFSRLADAVRKDLAGRYLGQAGLSVGEIAYMLHFREPPAFHRACKRWTGDTPLQYRATLFRGLDRERSDLPTLAENV
jgi:AraC-like DNA-binding protein